MTDIGWEPWAEGLAAGIALVVITTGLLQTAFYVVQLAFAGVALGRRPPIAQASALWRRYADEAPAIAVLAPAYNEELTVAESVKSLLALHYPEFEVIVVNDGSKDATLATLIARFGLSPVERYYDLAVEHKAIRGLYASPRLPRLLVVDKENGGKSDALNAGISVARSPLFCSMWTRIPSSSPTPSSAQCGRLWRSRAGRWPWAARSGSRTGAGFRADACSKWGCRATSSRSSRSSNICAPS